MRETGNSELVSDGFFKVAIVGMPRDDYAKKFAKLCMTLGWVPCVALGRVRIDSAAAEALAGAAEREGPIAVLTQDEQRVDGPGMRSWSHVRDPMRYMRLLPKESPSEGEHLLQRALRDLADVVVSVSPIHSVGDLNEGYCRRNSIPMVRRTDCPDPRVLLAEVRSHWKAWKGKRLGAEAAEALVKQAPVRLT